MKKLAVALAAAALVAVAPAQGQNNSDITIKASANPVVFKTPTTFDGRVKGVREGVDVVLQRRSSTTTTEYTTVTTVKTTGNGDYTFTVTPRKNGLFRTVSGTAVSKEIALGVMPKVVLRRVGPNGFAGRVRPAHDGRKVQLQKQNADGTWTTVRKARLRDTGKPYSRFRKRTSLAQGSYRVILPAHADHAQGESLAVAFNS